MGLEAKEEDAFAVPDPNEKKEELIRFWVLLILCGGMSIRFKYDFGKISFVLCSCNLKKSCNLTGIYGFFVLEQILFVIRICKSPVTVCLNELLKICNKVEILNISDETIVCCFKGGKREERKRYKGKRKTE